MSHPTSTNQNLSQSSAPAASISLQVQTYQSSSNLESQVYLSAFGQDAYLFKIHSLPLQLPADYSSAFKSLSQIASTKLTSIELGKNREAVLVKIQEIIINLLNAAKQIIYNFEPIADELIIRTEKCFNDLHTEICNINLAEINFLLQEAKRDFLMSERARKNLFFSIKLEEEMLKFVALFMNKTKIDMKEFKETFFNTFSYFYREKVDYLAKFEMFDQKVAEIKVEKFREYEERFMNELFDYFTRECEYRRVAVYCAKITEGFRLKEHEGYKWVMMCCFVMQKEEFMLSKPVEIAQNVMLIPLHMKRESFIIHYSPGCQSNLAKIAHANPVMVVQGSTPEKTFISCARDLKVQEHVLFHGKLDMKQDINLLIKDNEQINDIIYISETERFLMIVNRSNLISRTVGSTVRSELKFNDMDTELLSINVYKEKKMVCIKSSFIIKFYSMHLQCLFSFNIEGNIFCSVTTLTDEGYIILIAENKVIELKFVPGQDYRQESSRLIDLRVIDPCEYSMSRDRMDLIESSSIYMSAINKTFAVPDRNPAFRSMAYCSLEPDPIIFKKTNSQNPV